MTMTTLNQTEVKSSLFTNSYGERWILAMDATEIMITGGDIDWREIHVNKNMLEIFEQPFMALELDSEERAWVVQTLNDWTQIEKKVLWLNNEGIQRAALTTSNGDRWVLGMDSTHLHIAGSDIDWQSASVEIDNLKDLNNPFTTLTLSDEEQVWLSKSIQVMTRQVA